MLKIEDATALSFLNAAEQWLCDGYYLSIRYFASLERDGAKIWDAAIYLNPLPPEIDNSFQIINEDFIVGQFQRSAKTKKSLLAILNDAARGVISIPSQKLALPDSERIDYYTELHRRDRMFSELHLDVRAGKLAPVTQIQMAAIDNALRCATLPFDGLTDVLGWLGLTANTSLAAQPSITIKANPPVDLVVDHSSLSDDVAKITIYAHPKINVKKITLALRATPGDGLQSRFLATELINWGRAKGGIRRGVATIPVKNADNLLLILMLENQLIRRQWLIDSNKARNNRLLAAQHFDVDLKMTREAVFDSSDSNKFEKGVAALLFLLGFTPSVQVEQAAPDIIVTTPGGRMVIVECTTRIADFSTKLGKLVDRRGSLEKNLASAGHSIEVMAALVCRLPRDQIAAQAEELKVHKVFLVSHEDLASAFAQLRVPKDPDRILIKALNRMAQSGNALREA